MYIFKICVLIILAINCHQANCDDKEHQFYLTYDEFGEPHVRNINQQPRYDITVNKSDIQFYLYTRGNVYEPILINAEDFDGAISSAHFNPNRDNYFISHGYGDSPRGGKIVELKNSILQSADLNVFLIDWSAISQNEFYTTAVDSVNQLGAIMGNVIEKIVNKYDIPFSKVNMFGHSLGTHVIGATGAHLQGKANLIIAGDPAMPLFDHDDADRRLDITDAQFVYVIHTNGGFMGFNRSIGHADYYPNGGGLNQPGCGPDIFGLCAHVRALDLLSESFVSPRFRAKACDTYENFKNGLCDNNEVSYMGGLNFDKNASGKYYLDTADESPYALG